MKPTNQKTPSPPLFVNCKDGQVEICCATCIAELFKTGFTVHAALEALNPGGSARYIGLILEKQTVGIPTRRRKPSTITAQK